MQVYDKTSSLQKNLFPEKLINEIFIFPMPVNRFILLKGISFELICLYISLILAYEYANI